MGGDLLTKVWDNNEGNRPVESNSVVKVEQAPTNNLNSKLGSYIALYHYFHYFVVVESLVW